MALFSKEQLERFKHSAQDVLNKVIDQQVTIAVTGLSRSGKTAFITSLVNQLVNESSDSSLTFFDPVHEQRFIAAKRVPQKHLHIGRFDYEKAIQAFSKEPPTWPEPTENISELRIALRYKPKKSLLKYATEMSTLTIDITDYPGEWLLDLSMLNQTYEQWSEQMTELLMQSPRSEKAAEFIEQLQQFDPWEMVDENQLKLLSEQYTQLLQYFHQDLGLSIIQPGRFILPGELAGTPLLQFFPYTFFDKLDKNQYQNASDNSMIGMLRARFIEYKERVVRAFYNEHFSRFDRQIVLVDCLTPLNNSYDSFVDLQQAIKLILNNFNYGNSSLFSRLFSPRIDKLLFAATKADHVTPEQHPALISLFNQLVYDTKQTLNFDQVEMNTMAIASVKATKTGVSHYQGKQIPVIQGRKLSDNELITLFPGSVPKSIPSEQQWQKLAFNFIQFSPLTAVEPHQIVPHIRMDQVLQFLLADKMK